MKRLNNSATVFAVIVGIGTGLYAIGWILYAMLEQARTATDPALRALFAFGFALVFVVPLGSLGTSLYQALRDKQQLV
ncbi:hypothetical protein [Burkholderia ubonensis]|uniref:Uncharacterized protein n=1 Tax=Burkholderia ubonensis subsp. mesacidophila TaxID=265293 RepID=A0A2A4F950_9BURK|nr:hypothetical protein [Burkholderia ubonensis]PCE30353.1 hypothetical protein BZL54_21925 [Burkholderia ubonensis subsp. mesacidophila]